MQNAEKIIVDENFYLSQPNEKDKSSFVKYLNDKDIYERTLRLPSPYQESDAEWFINHAEEQRKEFGKLMNWSVRQNNGELIGGIGFHLVYGKNSHKDEIGYWLAKPFWGKGIMTKVVKRFCRFGFEEMGLIRIEATVFHFNDASAKVLEKCGFQLEASTLKNYYRKYGKVFDGKLYAVVK